MFMIFLSLLTFACKCTGSVVAIGRFKSPNLTVYSFFITTDGGIDSAATTDLWLAGRGTMQMLMRLVLVRCGEGLDTG